MKAILLCLFLVNFAFSQNYISLNYEKPSSQNVKDNDGYFDENVKMNGISIEWQRSLIKTEMISLKAGCKFNYSWGKFFNTNPDYLINSINESTRKSLKTTFWLRF